MCDHIDTWNIATVNAAFGESTLAVVKPFTVYVASKTEGERAAWKWVEKNKPAFVFNAVLPYYPVSNQMGRHIMDSRNISRGFNASSWLIHIANSSDKSFTPRYQAPP